jgi:hypothetical protein
VIEAIPPARSGCCTQWVVPSPNHYRGMRAPASLMSTFSRSTPLDTVHLAPCTRSKPTPALVSGDRPDVQCMLVVMWRRSTALVCLLVMMGRRSTASVCLPAGQVGAAAGRRRPRDGGAAADAGDGQCGRRLPARPRGAALGAAGSGVCTDACTSKRLTDRPTSRLPQIGCPWSGSSGVRRRLSVCIPLTLSACLRTCCGGFAAPLHPPSRRRTPAPA